MCKNGNIIRQYDEGMMDYTTISSKPLGKNILFCVIIVWKKIGMFVKVLLSNFEITKIILGGLDQWQVYH